MIVSFSSFVLMLKFIGVTSMIAFFLSVITAELLIFFTGIRLCMESWFKVIVLSLLKAMNLFIHVAMSKKMKRIPIKEGIIARMNFAVVLIGSLIIMTRIIKNKDAQAICVNVRPNIIFSLC